jgi:hypothetical protein
MWTPIPGWCGGVA